MKFLNKFIIILSSILLISLGSAKAETLQELAQQLNDLNKSISNLGTSEAKELIVIDKALNEITKAVEFVNDKINTGDVDAAVAALNFVDKTISDITTSTIPKEFETEVIKKGEDFSPEKMSEIADITNNLTASQNIKKQKLVQDMLEANINGLDTVAMSNTLNEIGIKTMSSDDFAEAISQAEQIRERANSSGQALRRARDISEELKDQERYGAIIGTSAGEVDLALRQVEVIREGDPRNFRAFEIEKYGLSLGLSVDSINKGIQAVYSGDVETEKQVTLEIFNAMKKSPDWEVGIEIDDNVLNGYMAETIAKQNVVYAIINNTSLKAFDRSPYVDGVVVHDVSGYIDAQKEHEGTVSDFANEIGNYMESIGSFGSNTIRDVKYQINRQGRSGMSSKTVAAMVMAELEGDEYRDAYYAVDRSWTDFEARGSETLAYTASKIEAIMIGDSHAHYAATYSNDYAIKLTDSQKAQVSSVYDNALDIINKQNASIALEEVKRATKIATETTFQLTPKINSLEKKVESLSSDKNYLTLKAEVDEVKEYQEKVLQDRTEGKITNEEYWSKIRSVQAGNTHTFIAKRNEFTKLQSEIDAVKKTVSATKRSIENSKNSVNTATQNAAKVGVSIEAISQAVSSTAEKTSVVAATAAAKEVKKAAQQATNEVAKASQKNKQAAAEAAVEAAEAAEQAAAKAAKAASAKAAKDASAAAAVKAAEQAAEQAKAATKASEQAAAKAAQAAQVAATKAAKEAADAAAKASQQAAEAAAQQAAKAAAVAAQEQAQQAARQAAAIAAKQASEAAHLAATQAAQQAADAAKQAAQQATEAAAQASKAAASEAAEVAANAAKQAAQQATQQLAAAAIQAAKSEVAKSANVAAVAAQAVADQAKKIADQYKNASDPNTPDLVAIRNTAKETAEKAAAANALSTAAIEAAKGIARASNEGYSETQIAIREAAVEALDKETKKAIEQVTQEAAAQVTEEIKIATTEAAVEAAKIAFAEGQTMTEADKQALVNQIQSAIQDLKAETSIGMSSFDPRYKEIRDKWREKPIEDRMKDFDKLDELKDAASKAGSIKTSD